MNYQIIATLGPSSRDEDCWRGLMNAGASAFRLNTSHLTVPELEGWIDRVGAFLARERLSAPLILDLQGSKWRLGRFEPFSLEAGMLVELALAAETGQPDALPVPHADFFAAASGSGGEIVMDDARVRLQVERIEERRVMARVVLGGPIRPGKGITFSNSDFRSEALSEKDRAILALARSRGFIHYAISYIKDAAEMQRVRAHFGSEATLIAKLERGSAMAGVVQIARHADALWVCRGDLGAELGLTAMAEAVWRISEQVRQIGAPLTMAGQVLEHMTASPTPTRSEVCYLHDCLMKGYRGLVLSDETAVGRYPVEACRAAALFRTAS